ncbi:sulfate transporter [Metarhizium acridum CQMa 102]|uniref:Sulfate transporter n=1 Tax=Metarhizium acridum (strain CQMa 102) TaxID=655827 RepID=E9DU75_METAQ|nr:sulfate transporter [Metarhizium acridum CQMa 102]EFY92935.1 sulfate transporter [Metarhizium acridum CQMa 102]
MGHSSHHRADSSSSKSHRPAQPSSLRQSHAASSRDSSQDSGPAFRQAVPSRDDAARGDATIGGNTDESTPLIPDGGSTERRRSSAVHPGVCNHGTFSPRPMTPDEAFPITRDDIVTTGPDGLFDNSSFQASIEEGWKKWFSGRIRTKRMGETRELAHRAGFRDTPLMYLSYYIPCLNWMRQYKWSYLKGDLVSAVTIASFYLPMALSLASNLAHVPPIHGLYAFVFNPFIYALLGSSSQMVVGPEAAGSLLVGTVVQQSVDSGGSTEDNDLVHAQICGVVAGMAGATVLIAGIARLGFLDSVLSRPFLRGFISAIGFVIAVDQLIPELGLNDLASKDGASHGSTVEKIAFIVENISEVHHLTFAVAGISFLVIMIFREFKKRLEPRFPSVVFLPDRFLVVVVSAILCWHFRWDKQGVEVLGAVKAANGGVFAFRWPFRLAHMKHIRSAMSTSFLIALLGFFESSVAAKSLGGNDAIQGIELSANREMIALGAANLVGACFMSLPAFGGYGRSKVNKTTGGKSPKPVLCSMISVVAYSLIEEAPHDIAFFVTIRGWTELGLMAIIFLSTIFYSLTLGMALGVGISILLVIKHSTRPRIQILGRIPGTNRFENAESGDACLEFVEGCLIVKIPEPLTFANTGELKARLRRLELYGTSKVHPALPRLRSQESNRNIIFDIHGVTSMDGSGTQVLEEIVRNYRERGVRIFFSRGPSRRDHPVWKLLERSGIVALSGGESHFVNDVEEALRWTEYEDSIGVRSGGSG